MLTDNAERLTKNDIQSKSACFKHVGARLSLQLEIALLKVTTSNEDFCCRYTYWFGELPVVAVTSYKTIIETFQKDGDAYAGRKTDFNPFSNGGVVDTEGELWLEHRRFTLHLLRELGLGKDLMQQRVSSLDMIAMLRKELVQVLDEVASLIAKVNKEMAGGLKEHDIASAIDISVGSVINTLLFGYRFDEVHSSFFLPQCLIWL